MAHQVRISANICQPVRVLLAENPSGGPIHAVSRGVDGNVNRHPCSLNRADVVLTMLKWSCVDTTVVRCGCSSRVGREFRFQPLLPYVSRKLRTDAGVWCPCTPRTLFDAPAAFQ